MGELQRAGELGVEELLQAFEPGEVPARSRRGEETVRSGPQRERGARAAVCCQSCKELDTGMRQLALLKFSPFGQASKCERCCQ